MGTRDGNGFILSLPSPFLILGMKEVVTERPKEENEVMGCNAFYLPLLCRYNLPSNEGRPG